MSAGWPLTANLPATPAQPQVAATARADLLVAAATVGALSVIGALLGFGWAWWSPPGPAAEVLGGGRFIPDETEAFIAGDGRFLVLAALTGLAAALAAWYVRPQNRGPVVLAGLTIGAAAGALLTELVGHLTGGGSFTGKVFTLADGSKHQVTFHLPLSLHAQGMLLVEPLIAVLVYGLFVSFAVPDDLGRPDPKRAEITRASSVRPGGYPQHGGGYGDAARPLQQSDFPPQ